MNESRRKGKCNCLDDDPQNCYELKQLKTGKEPDRGNVKHLCACPCHADYLDGDIDLVKGGC